MKILTFDIEEWFHILDNHSTKEPEHWLAYEERIHRNVDRLLELLDRHQSKATFFILGWIAEKYPEVVKKIDSLGHHIGSHSNMHQLCYELTPSQFEEDTRRSILSLEDLIGKKVNCYRAPGFSIKYENRWALKVLSELGIEIDCSIFPARRAHGGFQNIGVAEPFLINIEGRIIKEFPINTISFFGKDLVYSGGGYFRLLPYSLIKRWSSKADYVMTYFHPRDFDSTQPLIQELSLVRRFKSYNGLKSAYSKLDKWLSTDTFINLKEADLQTAWNQKKTCVIDLDSFEYKVRKPVKV